MTKTKRHGRAYLREQMEKKFISRLKKHLYYAWMNDENGLPYRWGHTPKITWRDLVGKPFFRMLRKTRKIDTDTWEQIEHKHENKKARLQARQDLKNTTNDNED